jgi:tetratricopeptide (TPR) repeat protein
MYLKIIAMIAVLLSFCYAQETAEDWFVQARCYEMTGCDSLALKAYEEAYKQDSGSFVLGGLVLVQYLKTNQFEKVVNVPENMIDLNDYKIGNKIAEFYCYAKDTVRAFNLWKSLVYNAVGTHQLDSALILANNFVQNLPQYSMPRKMQSWLLKSH